jgi:hypothetical protein
MSLTHAIPASVALSPSEIIALRPDAPLSDAQIALADRQLAQLERMAEIGMSALEDLEHLRSAPADRAGKRPDPVRIVHAIDKMTLTVRRIMVLEQEIAGLREKRILKVKHDLLAVKKTATRQNVERSLAKGKPDLPREKRERMLDDLFTGYGDMGKGTVREIVAQICEDLGIEADLSLWEEPSTVDIELPAGHDWIIPANGDKPYTKGVSEAGFRTRLAFDSPHLAKHRHVVAEPGTDPPKLE